MEEALSQAGMIERVSSVILEFHRESREWQHYTDDAFTIIREMRDPTPSMVQAGTGKSGSEAWKAMIDAILMEKP